MDSLKKAWFSSIPDVEEEKATRWWEVVCNCYSEKQRHYHTLNHLIEMFHHYEWSKQHVRTDSYKHPKLVTLAIFFHDIIYDPRSSLNEEKSAEKFEEFTEECGPLTVNECRIVKDWILKTKSHEPSKGDNSDDDLHFFLDIDMAVLGRDEKGYDEYASQIRSEYIHIPEPVYRSKRAEVLEDFCKRLPLFSTTLFQERFEEQAKKNLQREIVRLKDPSQPL